MVDMHGSRWKHNQETTLGVDHGRWCQYLLPIPGLAPQRDRWIPLAKLIARSHQWLKSWARVNEQLGHWWSTGGPVSAWKLNQTHTSYQWKETWLIFSIELIEQFWCKTSIAQKWHKFTIENWSRRWTKLTFDGDIPGERKNMLQLLEVLTMHWSETMELSYLKWVLPMSLEVQKLHFCSWFVFCDMEVDQFYARRLSRGKPSACQLGRWL